MSVTGRFWRMTAEEWADLEPLLDGAQSDADGNRAEEAFLDRLFADVWDENGRYLDIEKSWHLLDYLMTEHADRHSTRLVPLQWAIQGGTDTPFDDTDGKIRYLTADEVRAVAVAIQRVSVSQMEAEIDLEAINAAEIYDGSGHWERAIIQRLVAQYLPRLQQFYRAAAEAEQVVILARM